MPIEYPQTRARSNTSDSYPSLDSASSSEYDSDEEAAMIQEEWEENLKQFETVLSILIIPFFGRWYGRRFGYWREFDCAFVYSFMRLVLLDYTSVHATGRDVRKPTKTDSSVLAVSDSRLDKSVLWFDVVKDMYLYLTLSLRNYGHSARIKHVIHDCDDVDVMPDNKEKDAYNARPTALLFKGGNPIATLCSLPNHFPSTYFDLM